LPRWPEWRQEKPAKNSRKPFHPNRALLAGLVEKGRWPVALREQERGPWPANWPDAGGDYLPLAKLTGSRFLLLALPGFTKDLQENYRVVPLS
jgi:hypothetical protein